MDYLFKACDAVQFGLLPLVVYREASNQTDDAMAGVAWVVKNRVAHPGWWGDDIPSVILKHWQFSSFNWKDPNSQRFISPGPLADRIIDICARVFWGTFADPTGGAVFYHDDSLSGPPSEWGNVTFTVRLDDLLFYKA